MKYLSLALVVGAASAFTAPPATFAVGKKTPAKKAKATKPVAKKAPAKKAPVKKAPVKKAPVKKAPVKKAPVKKAAPKPAPKVRAAAVGTVPSLAIPGEQAPALLDGSLVGDVGFDPCFLSTRADSVAPYFNKLFAGNAPIDGLTWYREAELMHGRIAMMAVTGFIVPGIAHFGGNEWTGADAFATTNPLEALSAAPSASLFQIFAFMAGMEFRRISIILEDGAGYTAGDAQRWGQGEGRWNPFNFNYSPAEYEEKQLQEIKHARLAMVGLLGTIFQANASGVSVAEQWGAALTTPDYYAKAGYFLPQGI